MSMLPTTDSTLRRAKAARVRNWLYDEAVRPALTVLWQAADRGLRHAPEGFDPILVDARERHGHLDD